MAPMTRLLLGAALALLGTLSAPAAILLPFEITASSPTYNRTTAFAQGASPALSGLGTAVHYDVLTFTLATDSNIVLSLLAADGASISATGADTFLTLYSTFNPAAPLSGALAANDDSGATTLSRLVTTTPLAAGDYTVVLATFDNTPETGALPWTGNIALVIPEPSTYALLAGAAALGFAVWRRRRS